MRPSFHLGTFRFHSSDSSFSQTHKVVNVDIICICICIPIYLQFSSIFALTDFSKCEIRKQGVRKDYISKLHTSLDCLIFSSRGQMKLAMLAFLYCEEFVKNSIKLTFVTVIDFAMWRY